MPQTTIRDDVQGKHGIETQVKSMVSSAVIKEANAPEVFAWRRKHLLIAFGLFLLALLVRYAVCFGLPRPDLGVDSQSYFLMADGILAGQPLAQFPNGYPLLIAAVKLVFGPSFLNALIAINVLMSAAVVALVFLIACRMLTLRFAIVAALLVVFWPNQINYVRQPLTEVPSSFFLMLGIYFLLKNDRVASFVSGVAFFIAGMIRSTLSPVGYFSALYFFLVGRKRDAYYLLLGLIVGVFVSFVLTKADIVRPSNNMGENFLLSVHSGSVEGIVFSTKHFSDEQKADPVRYYVSFALNNPSNFAMQRMESLWELWGPWPNPGDAKNPRSNAVRFLLGLRFPVFLLAIYAAWRFRKNSNVMVCAIPVSVLTAVHAMFFSISRFTCTVEPLVLILAVLGGVGLWGQYSSSGKSDAR